VEVGVDRALDVPAFARARAMQQREPDGHRGGDSAGRTQFDSAATLTLTFDSATQVRLVQHDH
jgi:hypothetical protein